MDGFLDEANLVFHVKDSGVSTPPGAGAPVTAARLVTSLGFIWSSRHTNLLWILVVESRYGIEMLFKRTPKFNIVTNSSYPPSRNLTRRPD